MPQHIPLNYGDPAAETFFDATQEVLGTLSSLNLTVLNATTIRAVAGVESDQAGLGVDGQLRWRTSNLDVVAGGAAGRYDVWATAQDLNITPGSPPIDNTDYTYGISLVASGGAAPAAPRVRKVGYLDWNGVAITRLVQTAGRRDDTMLAPVSAAATVPALDATMPAGTGAGQAGIGLTVGAARVFSVDGTGAVSAVAASLTGAAGLTVSGAGGRDTLALTSQGADTGLTIGGDVELYRPSAGLLRTGAQLSVQRTNGFNVALGTRLVGEAVERFQMLADGSLRWTDGGGAGLASLAWSAAGQLTVSGGLVVSGALTSQGTLTAAGLSSTGGMTVSGGALNAQAGIQVNGVALAAAHLSDGVTGTGGPVALSASPALTGTPTAPTAAAGTVTTQLATTAFVGNTIHAAALVLGTAAGSIGFFGSAGATRKAGYGALGEDTSNGVVGNLNDFSTMFDFVRTMTKLIADLRGYGLIAA